MSIATVSPVEALEYSHTQSTKYVDHNEYRVHKSQRRLSSSTGGGRAWTEEEEAYLLRTRLHKMPYKHIAAQLNKTELACRLHYHQMSYGSNRRRRADSVSSTGSFGSMPGLRDTTPDTTRYTQLSPVPSPPSSPDMRSEKNTTGEVGLFQHQRAPVPILPKPELNSNPFFSSNSKLSDSLRLDTYVQHQNQVEPRVFIDPSKLRAIYESHRNSFWSMIASEYSSDSAITGRQLEDAFFLSNLPSTIARDPSPPTPGPSPEEKPSPLIYNRPSFSAPPRSTSVECQGFRAINHSISKPTSPDLSSGQQKSSPNCADRCAVSALLTSEKEVRTPN